MTLKCSMSDLMFDAFYKFDCSLDNMLCPLDYNMFDVKSRFFILPTGKNSFCRSVYENSFSMIDEGVKSVFVLIPVYNCVSTSVLLFSDEMLEKLNSRYNVDFEKLTVIAELYPVERFDFGFEYEEILIPYLDSVKGVKVVPIFFNDLSYGVVSQIFKRYWHDCVFVLLSNLSRGFNYKDALKIDEFTANCIERGINSVVSMEQFVGYRILNEVLSFVNNLGFSFVRLSLGNSFEINCNCATTVGYGAWFLYEGKISALLKTCFSSLIVEFVRFNLKKGLNIGCEQCFTFPEVFNQKFKIFVSFHKGDFVRGVSGSFKKVDICYLGIVKRVFSAAFSDNRFSPLKPEELEGLQVVVVFLEDSIMDSVVIEAVL